MEGRAAEVFDGDRDDVGVMMKRERGREHRGLQATEPCAAMKVRMQCVVRCNTASPADTV